MTAVGSLNVRFGFQLTLQLLRREAAARWYGLDRMRHPLEGMHPAKAALR